MSLAIIVIKCSRDLNTIVNCLP